jgi:hypothetical protein
VATFAWFFPQSMHWVMSRQALQTSTVPSLLTRTVSRSPQDDQLTETFALKLTGPARS